MARSSTGKSVARAAATGGGTSYRGQMPVNWYAALVVIVLIGIGSVVLARYNYTQVVLGGRHPSSGRPGTPHWRSTSAGQREPALTATASGSTQWPDHHRERSLVDRAQDE